MHRVTVRRFLCAIAGALAVGANAFAQQASPGSAAPPTFAVLSLVGDQFSVVFRRPETGSRVDTNDRREYPIDVATLDEIAVAAAEGVLRQLKPLSPMLRFSIRDPRLFALQDKLLVDSAESHEMREALAKLLRDNGASRLVLVTKWRDDAQFKLLSSTTGTGKIAGLGFYVDSFMRLHTTNTGEGASGFLGPFAYLSVSVIDVSSMTAIRSARARESDMQLPLNATGAVRAWDALSPAGKVDALERVLHRGVQNAAMVVLAD